jgi:predicted Zn-ribbon and HTH transcriptional regulator
VTKGEKFGGNGLVNKILITVNKAQEPLEAAEIMERVGSQATRAKVMYRLNVLRADQKINGKQLRAGKGVWVWWKK